MTKTRIALALSIALSLGACSKSDDPSKVDTGLKATDKSATNKLPADAKKATYDPNLVPASPAPSTPPAKK